MTDRIVALNLMGTAGVSANALCSAAVTATNPDLKRLYKDYLQEVLAGVEAMQTYVMDREWTKRYATPEEQLRLAMEDADALISVKA